jgi:hypothetical protein
MDLTVSLLHDLLCNEVEAEQLRGLVLRRKMRPVCMGG